MDSLDISLLANLPPFAGIEHEDLEGLLAQASSSLVLKGQYIFHQGEKAHSFFVLLDGHIRVVKLTPDGDQVIVRYISGGELLGIAHAIGSPVYPASAIAAVDCIVLSWPDAIWQQTIERYPTFATNTYMTIGSRLQDVQERIVEMATERVEQRVAHALLKLANQTGKQTDEGILIDFPISRQDISEMTGTTLHTVSRLLSGWEQVGMVKSGRQKVTIVDGPQLTRLADGRPGS